MQTGSSGACAIELAQPIAAAQADWRERLGCPTGPPEQVSLAWTPFENGSGLHHDDTLYILLNEGTLIQVDTPEPTEIEADVPAPFTAPTGVFAGWWVQTTENQDQLGWALTEVVVYEGLRQPFLDTGTVVYELGNDDLAALHTFSGAWGQLPVTSVPGDYHAGEAGGTAGITIAVGGVVAVAAISALVLVGLLLTRSQREEDEEEDDTLF
ncbi:MAG: hypothetical protein ACFB51_11050 [Anaerolineae bacterium]